MDKITFIKRNTGDEDELSCEGCDLQDVCSQTENLRYLIERCEAGDYWEIDNE